MFKNAHTGTYMGTCHTFTTNSFLEIVTSKPCKRVAFEGTVPK
jgi:hypothetical protein